MTRTWAVHDRVAIRDFVGTPWLLGDLIEISAGGNLVIDLGSQPTAIRYPDDVRVVLADEVPIDERHWLPASVRDQLVRQAAAEALARVRDVLDDDWAETREYLDGLVLALAHGVGPTLAAIARAALAPSRKEVADAQPSVVTSP